MSKVKVTVHLKYQILMSNIFEYSTSKIFFSTGYGNQWSTFLKTQVPLTLGTGQGHYDGKCCYFLNLGFGSNIEKLIPTPSI